MKGKVGDQLPKFKVKVLNINDPANLSLESKCLPSHQHSLEKDNLVFLTINY